MASPDPPVTLSRQPPTGDAPQTMVAQIFDRDGLYSLRAAVAAHASAVGASATEVDRLLIVASELATNAIRHGGGSGRLRLWQAGPLLHCEVSDSGSGLQNPDVGTSPPAQLAAGGRGIWICRQLCESVTIDSGPGGTVITARLRFAASSPAPGPAT